MSITDRMKHAWNAFKSSPIDHNLTTGYGVSSSISGTRLQPVYSRGSFTAPIINRIALDVAATEFSHVKVNLKNEDREPLDSGLNNCMNVEANIDQTGFQLFQDIVYSMLDEGVVAVVPVDTKLTPSETSNIDIETLRVGRITQWFPRHVEVDLYNEETGVFERIVVPKSTTAILENPLNPNSNADNPTLKRLMTKINLLDSSDERTSGAKLEMFIKLPYAVKSEYQREIADKRIKDLEAQLLSGMNKFGIGWIDNTENITQLTRPINESLSSEVELLNEQYHNQIGLTQNVLKGTASEEEMRNYYVRTIDPIVTTIVKEFERKFLSKTARSQGHRIEAFRDPFKLVSVKDIVAIGDPLRRNYVATPNEVRRIIGLKTSNDPRADELFNPNISDKNQVKDQLSSPGSLTPPDPEDTPGQNE